MPGPAEISHKPPVPESFGAHLARLRQEAKLSVAAAAGAAGLSAEEWSRMEADQSFPRGRMIRPMAAALGVKPHEVL